MSANLRKGDVVVDEWGAPSALYLVTGITARETGPHSVTECYKTQRFIDGKHTSEALFATSYDKLRKIGHVDYEQLIFDQLKKFK